MIWSLRLAKKWARTCLKMTADDAVLSRILEGLNEEQRQAVTAPARGQLQIVAGPGTGKTKVLTARVAYLLVHHKIQPWQMIVTTFTRKASKEMKDRLAALLEGTEVGFQKLMIGTFHSICIRLMRKYGTEIGLDKKFYIANSKDISDILEAFLEDMKPELDGLKVKDEENEVSLDLRSEKDSFVVAKIKKHISHLKTKAWWPEDYGNQKKHSQELSKIYAELQKRMQSMNMLDFDDILMYTVRLLRSHVCLSSIRHVLVDEFQDTNGVQMELVCLFAAQNKYTRDNLTVVGDVDQSIYAFRGANAENFNTFQKIYPACVTVKLKENYRSTQDVLDASELFMRQQNDRPQKDMKSQHSHSFPIVYQNLKSEYKEAQFIAQEIRFIRSLPGLYQPKDIAVLVRANYMTRVIERELSSNGLPYAVVKGRAFWERKEVMAIIDLLKTVGRRGDRCALVRSLGVFGIGIGAVTMKKIATLVEERSMLGVDPLKVLRYVGDGTIVVKAMTQKAKVSCMGLVELLDQTRSLYGHAKNAREDVLALFDFFCKSAPLQKVIGEEKEREDNVQEVRKQLEVYVPEDLTIEGSDEEEGIAPIAPHEEADLSFLESFLNSVDIYTPGEVAEEQDDSEDPYDKISLSTVHAAKGLEWPVVFVVGLNKGQFPSGRTDEVIASVTESVNEDRRVFYVATTRAKHILYVTTSSFEESPFLEPLVAEKKVSQKQVAFKTTDHLRKLYDVAGSTAGLSEKDAEKFQRQYATLIESRLEDGLGTYKQTSAGTGGFTFASGKAPSAPQYAPRPVSTLDAPSHHHRKINHAPSSGLTAKRLGPIRARIAAPLAKAPISSIDEPLAPITNTIVVARSDEARPSNASKPRKKTLGMKRRRF